jgi:hypothetical protein
VRNEDTSFTEGVLSINTASPFWKFLEAQETSIGLDPARSFGSVLRGIKVCEINEICQSAFRSVKHHSYAVKQCNKS